MSATDSRPDHLGLAGKAERILCSLDALGGRANTSEIREATGIQARLVRYHTDTLAANVLVEIVGEENVGNVSPAKVYSITERGEEAVEALQQRGGETAAEERAELRRRLDRLEAKVDSLAEGQATNEESINDLDDDLGDLVDDLSAEFPVGGD